MSRFKAARKSGRMRAALVLTGLLAAGMATPALAQQADSAAEAEGPGIIVQGERELDTKELRDAIRDVAMRGRHAKQPLPRYQMPLCPRALGLPERMAAHVVARIRSNTIEAGYQVDEDTEGCTANALLIVVDDQETLIKRMRKTNPALFSARISREIKAAQRRGDGAITWSSYAMQGPNGRLGAASGTVRSNILETSFANAGGAPGELRLSTPSSFAVQYSLEKMATIMVIDVDRLDGVHLDQLADFATMRILGQPQPTIDIEQDGAVSILNLFDVGPEAAPLAMTALDRAYLKGLYAMRPNEPANRLERFVRLAYEELRPELALDEAEARQEEPASEAP